MNFTIREAVYADAETICILNCDKMGYTFSLEETKANILKLLESNKDKIFVAVADGRVVGYVHACDYDLLYAPSMKNIMGLAVKREYKRNGIGRALLQYIENRAKETSSCCVRLISGAERIEAHAFYRSCGYVEDKHQIKFKMLI